MSKIWLSPTGRLSKGHVLDVSEKPFLRALQDFDHQLYVKWNPKKLKGWGCWEIRRRPNLKSVKDIVEFEGVSYVCIDYVENDLENHVLDVAFLNYNALTKVKSMDQWGVHQKYYVDQLESKEQSHQEAVKAKARTEMLYHAKQERRAFQEFREALQSGMNPHQIANHWK